MRELYLVLLFTLIGCTNVYEPENWESFDPPPYYQTWHHEVEVCVQVQRPFDEIVWRKVYAQKFPCGASNAAVGCFVHPKTIYLVEAHLTLEWLVKAELIHYVRHNISHDELFYQCEGR